MKMTIRSLVRAECAGRRIAYLLREEDAAWPRRAGECARVRGRRERRARARVSRRRPAAAHVACALGPTAAAHTAARPAGALSACLCSAAWRCEQWRQLQHAASVPAAAALEHSRARGRRARRASIRAWRTRTNARAARLRLWPAAREPSGLLRASNRARANRFGRLQDDCLTASLARF